MYDGKRYRVHNNYFTAGAGFLSSSLRDDVQKTIGLNMQFHIQKQHFQIGLLMSGIEFLSNNNISGHLGYGFRKENTKANYAIYAGPNYFTGVFAVPDSGNRFKPKFYSGIGGYICVQAIKKFTYDIGGGIELYLEANKTQIMCGLKFILFFSNSYRGLKRNYNPNVKQK